MRLRLYNHNSMKKYLKLFLILGTAFIISDYSIKNVFLAQSPKFNPYFAQNTLARASSFWSKSTNLVASINLFPKNDPSNINNQNNNQPSSFSLTKQQVAESLQTPLSKVSQGVYAGERDNKQVVQIKMNEIDYLEYTFNVDGKQIKIKVPKDQQPPSQEQMEALYK